MRAGRRRRRAARIGDGFLFSGRAQDEAVGIKARMEARLAELGRGDEAFGFESIIWVLVFANVSLMLFNLLPAFPLDGGRVLRGLLTLFMPIERATHFSARIGQGSAVLMVILGLLLPNPVLVMVAFLIFFGATQELYFQRSRSQMHGRSARDAMITRYETLAPQSSLEEAGQLMLEGNQQAFPVIDVWQRVAGIVTRPVLFDGLSKGAGHTAVLEVMERDFPTAAPDSPLEEVLEKLQNVRRLPVFVIQDNQLVGIVTLENLGEMVELSRLIQREQPRSPESICPDASASIPSSVGRKICSGWSEASGV